MRLRTLILAALCAGLAAPSATAAVVLTPNRINPDATVMLTFRVENESFNEARPTRLTLVNIELPERIRIESVQAKEGWIAQSTANAISWRGGSVLYGRFETFSVVATMPPEVGTLRFPVTLSFAAPDAGTADIEYADLQVVEPTDERDTRTIAKAALIIAIVGAVFGVAAFLMGLARWLRG